MNAAGRRSRSHNDQDGAHNHDPNASAATLTRHGITDALTASVSCDGRTPSRSTGSPHPNREPHAAVRPQRPSRTSRSNTPSLLSRVQRREREAAKSAELGQASVRARDTRHPLGGNAPVQKGCNAYGSGVAPRETRTNAEAARTSDTSTSASTPPWRVVLRRRQACGHQLPLVRRAWSWRTASQPKSPELHWYGVATDRYSEACEPCR